MSNDNIPGDPKKDETASAAKDGGAGKVIYRVSMEKRDGLDIFRPVVSNAFEPEDDFQEYYIGGKRQVGAILPPYDLRTLDRLCQENNALSPCIEAMVTNVDGTGFDIKHQDEVDETTDGKEDKRAQELMGFFAEPWPGESFISIRKKLRRDIERVGNGYLEILRNGKGDVIELRHVDAKMIRLVKLDDKPIAHKVKLQRWGKEVEVTNMTRFRKFCQLLNGKETRYFKEFGCPAQLHKTRGHFEGGPEEPIPLSERASEMMHFTCLPDAHTPYGVPRWISQLPSVLGSRKAEEFNGEFFDNGGVPPVLLLLQGGALSSESRKALEQRTMGSAARKQRVMVVEMDPTGGSIDNPMQSKVTVERFGGERSTDSMFENYDKKCEERIRRAFRLPPLFVGHTEQMSFATAYASYTVAEAQVFRPERDEFDEALSIKLIAAMGYPEYAMVSRPLAIEDATLKLQGIEIAAATKQVPSSVIVREVNDTVGTRMVADDDMEPVDSAFAPEPTPAGISQTSTGKPKDNSKNKNPTKTPARSPSVRKNWFRFRADPAKAS